MSGTHSPTVLFQKRFSTDQTALQQKTKTLQIATPQISDQTLKNRTQDIQEQQLINLSTKMHGFSSPQAGRCKSITHMCE